MHVKDERWGSSVRGMESPEASKQALVAKTTWQILPLKQKELSD